jgi:hypothetical protein
MLKGGSCLPLRPCAQAPSHEDVREAEAKLNVILNQTADGNERLVPQSSHFIVGGGHYDTH